MDTQDSGPTQDLDLSQDWEGAPTWCDSHLFGRSQKHIWPEPKTKICFLLERLPQEIRDKILRLLLYRPTGIVPFVPDYCQWGGPIPWEIYTHKHWTGVGGYSFDDQCQNPPSRGHCWNCQVLEVTWTTSPSPAQRALVTRGVPQLVESIDPFTGEVSNSQSFVFPDTTDAETGDRIQHYLHRRHDGSLEVVHRKHITVLLITGLGILRTCKKIHTEGCEILYGENLFVFNNVRRWSEKGYRRFCLDNDLATIATHLPGISRDPDLISKNEVSVALRELFSPTKDWYYDSGEALVHWDSLLNFIRRIGVRNASMLTRIKLEGGFQVYHDQSPSNLDFSDMLRCYLTVMNRVGCNIKTLTLHTRDAISEDRRAAQRAEESVAMLVDGLPTLNKLQLGQYRFNFRPRPIDDWGNTVRWSKIVSRKETGNKPIIRPSAESIWNDIEMEAEEYFDVIISGFRGLAFGEGYCASEEYGSSYNPRLGARGDREYYGLYESNRALIYLGASKGEKFFKWMGTQYSGYKWSYPYAPDERSGLAWTQEEWDSIVNRELYESAFENGLYESDGDDRDYDSDRDEYDDDYTYDDYDYENDDYEQQEDGVYGNVSEDEEAESREMEETESLIDGSQEHVAEDEAKDDESENEEETREGETGEEEVADVE